MYDEVLATEILKILNIHYPDRLHFHQLKAHLNGLPTRGDREWLRVLDALQGDGKLTGKFLRTGINQLEDAAMLQITPVGRSFLQNANLKHTVQLDSRLNIPNEGEFDRDLEVFCKTASSNKPLSLIFVDIDHFKNINDTYGHETGNEVLKQIAETLTAGCKGKAKVYRYGGDEMAILAENLTLSDATALAERLRAQIEKIRGVDQPPSVTASIGVSSFPEPIKDPEKLFKSADDAAYKAKKNGRNQVRTVA